MFWGIFFPKRSFFGSLTDIGSWLSLIYLLAQHVVFISMDIFTSYFTNVLTMLQTPQCINFYIIYMNCPCLNSKNLPINTYYYLP